jgi:hypothetical protein
MRFQSEQKRLRTTLKNQQQKERKDGTGKDSYRTSTRLQNEQVKNSNTTKKNDNQKERED